MTSDPSPKNVRIKSRDLTVKYALSLHYLPISSHEAKISWIWSLTHLGSVHCSIAASPCHLSPPSFPRLLPSQALLPCCSRLLVIPPSSTSLGLSPPWCPSAKSQWWWATYSSWSLTVLSDVAPPGPWAVLTFPRGPPMSRSSGETSGERLVEILKSSIIKSSKKLTSLSVCMCVCLCVCVRDRWHSYKKHVPFAKVMTFLSEDMIQGFVGVRQVGYA